MPIQTTYGFTHAVGEEGLSYGVGPKEIITCYSETIVYPGRAVAFTTSYAEDASGRPRVIHPTAITGFTLAGIVEKVRNEELQGVVDGLGVVNSTQDMYYLPGTPIPVMIKGSLYVYAEVAVNPTSPVFTRAVVSGGNTVIGRFRNNADTTGAFAVPGARFTEAVTAAGLVPLRINMPTA
ncbi:MAG: hypothetical protein KME47_09420 [Nodosilinea sp. WJT8-NPBG4]|jgi:hypothetical protein|nr:hypothetical protein [Nodosilinea sp. WJT8-NPBG4]